MKEWAALDQETSGAHLTTYTQMIFKILHDPKSQKDLDKDSKYDFHWEQWKWTPTQCKDCFNFWLTNFTGRWPYSSSWVILPSICKRSKWYCQRKKKMTEKVMQENKLLKIYLFRSSLVSHTMHPFGRTYIMAALIHYKKIKLCLVLFCLMGQGNMWYIFKELKKIVWLKQFW